MEEKMSTARIKKLNGTFTFRIENYTGLSTRIGDSTESPEFDLCGHVWQLRIFPGGSLEVHRGHVSFYLASKSTRAARASYKLLVINQSPTGADETFASSGIRTFEARGVQVDGWGRDKFMSVATLMDPTKQFIVNDTVIFKVEITVYGDLESAGFPVVSSLHSASSTCLTKALHNMIMKADINNADLLLIVGKEQKKVWCHRCILAARSSVFYAMLHKNLSPAQEESWTNAALSASQQVPPHSTSSMPTMHVFSTTPTVYGGMGMMSLGSTSEEEKDCREESKLMGADAAGFLSQNMRSAPFLESHTGIVIMPDLDHEVLSEFLVFIYTDALSDVMVLSTMANSLLALSAKYDVPSLFNFVEEYLCLQLTVDTAVELLRLADMYGATKLKEIALKTVVQNALVLTDTSDYKHLHSSLLGEIERQLEDVQRLQQCCLTGSSGSDSVSSGRRSQCTIM